MLSPSLLHAHRQTSLSTMMHALPPSEGLRFGSWNGYVLFARKGLVWAWCLLWTWATTQTTSRTWSFEGAFFLFECQKTHCPFILHVSNFRVVLKEHPYLFSDNCTVYITRCDHQVFLLTTETELSRNLPGRVTPSWALLCATSQARVWVTSM